MSNTSDSILKDYDYLMQFCFEHGGTLRNHIAFGTMARELRVHIVDLEAEIKRVILAARGRGMVSEMENMDEVVVLVCGLHDRLAKLNNVETVRVILERTFKMPIAESDAQFVIESLNQE